MENQKLGKTPQEIFNEILEGEIYKDLVMTTENGTPFALALQKNNREIVRTFVRLERKKIVDEHLTDEIKNKYGDAAQIVATYTAIENLREKNNSISSADLFNRELSLRAEDSRAEDFSK